jgi:hypothetical protein
MAPLFSSSGQQSDIESMISLAGSANCCIAIEYHLFAACSSLQKIRAPETSQAVRTLLIRMLQHDLLMWVVLFVYRTF